MLYAKKENNKSKYDCSFEEAPTYSFLISSIIVVGELNTLYNRG